MHGQRRRAVYSLCVLLPFCMVFMVEMSCLIGKLPTNGKDCLKNNLCHGHSIASTTPTEGEKPHPALEAGHDHKHRSPDEHATHEHDHASHAHEVAPCNGHHQVQSSTQAEGESSCEAAARQEPKDSEIDFIQGSIEGVTTLENCCIDDSVRFFSTPTYFQSNDLTTSIQAIQLSVCHPPMIVLLSFEEKPTSFKPPENETLPTFSRFERFQVYLI